MVFTFAAYGKLLAVHGATGTALPATAALTSLGYSGEHFDATAQQQYLRARWYDPASGRFNRLDPFAGDILDPQSLHKYAYVHGDPIQGTDPTGKWSLGSVGIAMAIGASIGGVSGGFLGWRNGGAYNGSWSAVGEGIYNGALYGAAGGLFGYIGFFALSSLVLQAGASATVAWWIATIGSGASTEAILSAHQAFVNGNNGTDPATAAMWGAVRGAAFGGLIGGFFRHALPSIRLGMFGKHVHASNGSTTGNVRHVGTKQPSASEVRVAERIANRTGGKVVLKSRTSAGDQPGVDGVHGTGSGAANIGRPIQIKSVSGANAANQPAKVVARANEAFAKAYSNGWLDVDIYIEAPNATLADILARWSNSAVVPAAKPMPGPWVNKITVFAQDAVGELPISR